jgi:6-phosphogluconolactonase
MMMGRWAYLALAGPLLLAGCKGFWDAPTTSGSGDGTGTTSASSGDFYVLNAAKNQIAGFYVNAGNLTALSGSPYDVAATPVAIAVAHNNNFLYVSTAAGIYLYSIASSGQLTIGNSGNPISSDPASTMQVDANNSWLVEAASGISQVFAIPINPSTGAPTSSVEQYATLPASTIQQLTISPDNLHVLVAMGAGGTAVVPFTSGNTNPLGTVNTIPVYNAAGAALSVAVDPQDRIFYVGETAAVSGSDTGGLRAFRMSDLTELSGSPFASAGLAPYSILPVASAGYVYVANRQTSSGTTGVIKGFSVSANGTTYSLTALGSTFTAGVHTVMLAEDRTATFVFAVNYDGSSDLTGYTYDTTNAGYLDKVLSVSTGTDPVQATGIAVAH